MTRSNVRLYVWSRNLGSEPGAAFRNRKQPLVSWANEKDLQLKIWEIALGNSRRHALHELGVIAFQVILHAGDVHHLHGDALLVLELEVLELCEKFADLNDVNVSFTDAPKLAVFQGLSRARFLCFNFDDFRFHFHKTDSRTKLFINLTMGAKTRRERGLRRVPAVAILFQATRFPGTSSRLFGQTVPKFFSSFFRFLFEEFNHLWMQVRYVGRFTDVPD